MRHLFWHTAHGSLVHVSFGQREDTELWNNQFPESKILGVLVSRLTRALVYNMVLRDSHVVNQGKHEP